MDKNAIRNMRSGQCAFVLKQEEAKSVALKYKDIVHLNEILLSGDGQCIMQFV